MFGASDYPYTPEQHEEFPTHTVPKIFRASPPRPSGTACTGWCTRAFLMGCAMLWCRMQVLPVAASAVVIVYNVPGQLDPAACVG